MNTLKNSKELAFYCSSESWGGLEMLVVRIARWMRDRGWKIRVYCQKGTSIDREAAKASLPVGHITLAASLLDVLEARSLLRRFREMNTAAVFVFLNRDISVIAWLRKMSGASIRSIYLQTMGLGVNKRDLLHTRRYAQLDAWISPLVSLRNEVLQRTRMRPDALHCIHLGVEVERFSEELSQAEARRTLGLPVDGLCVGVIGRLDPAKGQKVVLEALALLRARDSRFVSVHLAFMGAATLGGGSDYERELQATVHEKGMSDVVHMLAFSDSPFNFFRAIDLCVMATRSETYGLVTVEAMLSACSIIGTNSGGTPELLDFGRRGALFEPQSVEACAAALAEALAKVGTEQERIRVERCAAEVRNLYSSHRQCEELERVLSSLLQ